jgi:hypothetical protein
MAMSDLSRAMSDAKLAEVEQRVAVDRNAFELGMPLPRS